MVNIIARSLAWCICSTAFAQSYTIAPTPQMNIRPGATVQYSTNLQPPVVWNVRPAVGIMCPGGLYIAPSNLPTATFLNITASSAGVSATTFGIVAAGSVAPGTVPTICPTIPVASQGPMGPPGPQGPQGIQGPQGPPGPVPSIIQPTYIPTAQPAWFEFSLQDDGTWLIANPPLSTDGHPINPTLVIAGSIKMAGADFTSAITGQGISLALRQGANWTGPVMGLWIEIR